MAAVGASLPMIVGWMLTVFGHTLVITHSTIVAPLRQRLAPSSFFGTLIRCPTCAGWWVGAFWAVFGLRAVELGPTHLLAALSVLANAFSGSGLCWLMHNVLGKLGGLQRLGIEPKSVAPVLSIVRSRNRSGGSPRPRS